MEGFVSDSFLRMGWISPRQDALSKRWSEPEASGTCVRSNVQAEAKLQARQVLCSKISGAGCGNLARR